MNIGFIGTGKITNACVRYLVGKGHNIIVTERNVEISRALVDTFDDVKVGSLDQIQSESDVIFIALMESMIEDVLGSMSFKKDQTIISFVLGVDLTRLHSLCAPVTDIAITIPLPMIEHGKCPLPVYPNCEVLKKIFGEDNLLINLSNEASLIPYFAATALLSSSLAQLETAKKWLQTHLDEEGAAERYLISLMSGTYSSLKLDGRGRINEALDSLSTKGGLNAQLRDHMKQEGTEKILYKGLLKLGERLNLD